MKVAAFLTIGTASSLAAPSAAKAAAPPKTSMAARAEISDFLDQMFTFYLRADQLGGWSHDRTRQNCHKRANHPLKCLWKASEPAFRLRHFRSRASAASLGEIGRAHV